MSKNPIVNKIMKLLALAADQQGRPEGELAAEKAAALMRDHAVAQADLPKAEADLIDPDVPKHMHEVGKGWRIHLAWALASHCSLYALRAQRSCCLTAEGGIKPWDEQTKRERKQRSFVYAYLCGKRSDIEVYHYLYSICERQIMAAAKAYAASEDSNDEWWSEADYEYKWGTSRKLVNAFTSSAVQGLQSKLREMRDNIRSQDQRGYGLVVDRRRRAKEMYTGTTGSGFKSARRHSAEGYQAGRNVNLSAGVKGGTRRTPIAKTHRIGSK